MVQLEWPRVIDSLISSTFGVHSGVPFSLDAGKGKCSVWPVKKVEIYSAKIGSMDCNWSN